MLNNYTLYRDTIDEMIEVYDRNDVYIDGTTIFSPDKMMGRLPVMIVTGDIPTLENTSDKDTQIIVDIDYYNMQDTSRSFRMVGAAMRPQGTSSMGYPKKNFRIYTKKVDGTILYDSNGNVVNDKLYSFKEKAQPVDCWCLKADYAESSGTHNTGIARLWNDALLNAQVDGEYVCRTGAQKAAIAVNYEYDVRTTIDGFPILLFYHQTVDDDLIFIGKYNFNNDKSTESVFGFKNIPNFDNSKMQCWEVLNNGNPLALFTTTDGFDENWSEAFESRYPDTKTPNTSYLKAFCQWMVNVTQEDFATQKWEHLNIYMMAAYWCYLMRHAGADQFVKNAMFTSEDGQHFYYILYDNDTINGLINTGRLRIKPTDNRQTIDESGAYVFAGHDSRLWNLLEADKEFIDIVSAVDNALYSAGISYANTIRVFDEEQADKWVEKVYNQDAQYKYVGPYVEKGIDNLFMLQGKRDLHRKWWLAKRFSIYDAKYVSGTYKSQAVELKCINGTPAGQTFTITAGYPIDYGFGINNVPREFGISLNIGETHTFTTREVVNLGDPIRIYGAPNIAGIDISTMAQQLAVITIANVYDEALGTKLTKLIIGKDGVTNNEVTEISGLKQATALEELDIQGMKKIISLDLSNHAYFKSLKAFGSGISSITFAKGSPLTNLELPSTMRVLSLEQLPYLTINKLLLEDVSNIQDINIISCPNLSQSFSFVYDWYKSKNSANKVCSLVMDNIVWENVDSAQLLDLFKLKTDGGELDLKGRISIPNATLTLVRTINNLFGGSAFFPTSELYFEVPPTIELSSDKESVLEGENIQFSYELYPALDGKITYSLTKGRSGCSINPTTGLLTTSEKAVDTSDIIARVTFVSNDGKVNIYDEKSVQVVRRTYPQGVELIGNSNLIENDTFLLEWDNETNGSFSVDWSISSGVDGNYAISSYSNNECKLERESIPNDTISGTLTAKIRRNFDNAILETISIPISHEIYWPESAYIDGEENPKNNNVYVSVIDTNGVTGNFNLTWQLSGDILSYFELEVDEQNNAVLNEIEPPISKINGVLNLTIRKTYNNETILSIDKPLVALIPGVVINYKDNAPIQSLMYSKGFVANELYSLKEEIEAITASELQTGTSATTSIFYAARNNITHFEEFEYFTGVTYIPAHCFSYLTKMTSIKLPNTITDIRNNAFGVNTSTNAGIRSIEIPEGVTTIGNSAFIGCDELKTATFPSTLTSIGNNTFEGCTNLQSVILKEGVTSIGNSAFKSCTNLAEFSIPSTLSSIGTNIFERCNNLYITVNSNNQKYASMDGVLFNKNYTSLYKYAKGNKEKSYIIPDGVTTLEQYSFQYSPLEEVTLPSSLKTIAAYSFLGATSLAKITSNALSAPSTTSTSFGNSDSTYAGRNNYSSGTNEIFIQNNSTGYESSYWLDPLQNASKSGFSIHGKLVISSNTSSGKFDVTYNTITNESKTINVGVGTSYLSDIKVGTNVTINVTSSGLYDWYTKTITYSGEMISVENNISSSLIVELNSNQSNDSVISALKVSVSYEDTTLEVSSLEKIILPLGVSVIVSFPFVEGYTQPSTITYTTGIEEKIIIGEYNTMLLYVSMSDNQTSYNDIANVKATIKYGSKSFDITSGNYVKVPFGESITIIWGEVVGYRTPNTETFIASDSSITKTGTYLTEILTVNVTSDIALPTSYTITVSGIGSQKTATAKYKIPFGNEYTISASSASGYKTPASQTFIANSVSRSVTITYLEFIIGSWITMNQNNLGPDSIISGDVNGEHIQLIRQNSHRYLGKYSSDTKTMTICQLDDSDSNLFYNGLPALLDGTHGDVFMKLPRFWYKSVNISSSNWKIGFYFGEEIEELQDWMEWDGKELIGVFSASLKNKAFYSVATGSSPVYQSISNISTIKSYLTARGSGYSLVRWEHHCIMAFLFFAMYGNTNSQAIIGIGGTSTSVGSTASLGMQDTQGGSNEVNFWGLERWWGAEELLDESARCNVGSIDKKIQVTMRDGTVRKTEVSINEYSNRFCSKISIGLYLDVVGTGVNGSSTTGYCDVNYMEVSSSALNGYVTRGGGFGTERNGITSYKASYLQGTYHRIAFYGNIIEEKDTYKFITL